MTARPAAPVLATLALGDDGGSRGLYWRGSAQRDDAGGLRLDPGQTVDLGTWFNAAPVGWWREILHVDGVRLQLAGVGEVTVFRAGRGTGPERVRTLPLDGANEIDLPTTDVIWYWIELRAVGAPGRLESMCWSVIRRPVSAPGSPSSSTGGPKSSSPMSLRGSPPDAGATRSTRESTSAHPVAAGGLRVTAVVPTYGRERDALDQVRRLLGPGSGDVVARVVLVDQAGTVRAAPGATEAIAAAGDRLLLVEQGNLGGSGGYARGMLESLAFPDDAVLLLDDDARIDPESLRRMVILSGLATSAGTPTILGAPLLSAEQPTRLAALAEGVRRRDFRWGPSDGLTGLVDVSVTNPAGWSFADPTARTDYSGWWATLLPPGAVADLGLPAPYFLKWDDAEYGLRAGRAGYRVSAVPGTGAWHPTWSAKGTISSWAAWPLHRNRLATAASYRAGRGVLVDSLVHQVKHLLSLQYDTADLWDAALAQFLAGPGWLAGDLSTIRERAQAVLDAESGRAIPGSVVTSGHGIKASWGKRPPVATGASGARSLPAPRASNERPSVRLAVPMRALRAAAGLVRRPATRHLVRVAPEEFTWLTGLGRDAVLLTGTNRALVRDPIRARGALARTVRLHAMALRRWNALRRAYAAALPISTTADRWRGAFDRR